MEIDYIFVKYYSQIQIYVLIWIDLIMYLICWYVHAEIPK